jgi:hypothetical protein
MEHVSVLLRHSSANVTEERYAPWVRKRQERLEAGVRWAREAVVRHRKATPDVQEEQGAVN